MKVQMTQQTMIHYQLMTWNRSTYYDGYYEHLETVINAELGMNGYSDEDVVSVSFPHSRLCIIACKSKERQSE